MKLKCSIFKYIIQIYYRISCFNNIYIHKYTNTKYDITQCNLLSITYKVFTDAFYHITLNNTIKLSSKTVHDTPYPSQKPTTTKFSLMHSITLAPLLLTERRDTMLISILVLNNHLVVCLSVPTT